MRLTLEQLKAMDERELWSLWADAEFPFDATNRCCNCLTVHARGNVCDIPEHTELIKNAAGLSEYSIKPNLERFYALRIFYDNLYFHSFAEPAEVPAAEPAVAIAEVSHEQATA